MKNTMKKFAAVMLAAALVTAASGCDGKKEILVPEKTENEELLIGGDPATWGPDGGDEGENVQIPNPWQEYQTLEEAAAAAGFDLTASESIDGYSEKTISVMGGTEAIFEIAFRNAAGDQVCIRKAAGTENISGDYNDYDKTETVSVGELEVTEKGNGGSVNLALWNDGGYTYSLYISTGASADEAAKLVSEVK